MSYLVKRRRRQLGCREPEQPKTIDKEWCFRYRQQNKLPVGGAILHLAVRIKFVERILLIG